jgi:hypothetical protein
VARHSPRADPAQTFSRRGRAGFGSRWQFSFFVVRTLSSLFLIELVAAYLSLLSSNCSAAPLMQ